MRISILSRHSQCKELEDREIRTNKEYIVSSFLLIAKHQHDNKSEQDNNLKVLHWYNALEADKQGRLNISYLLYVWNRVHKLEVNTFQ